MLRDAAALLILTGATIQVAPGEESTIDANELRDVAVSSCPLNRRPTEEQQRMIEELLDIELESGVPMVARGLLVAAACREAAYKLRVGCGDDGASCGLFQFHGSHKRRLRSMGAVGDDPRSDWRVGARYWLRLVRGALDAARRDCPGNGGYLTREAYLWASANKTATWKYKCGRWGRCIATAADGSCSRYACVRRAARCSVPPWRWKGKGRHRRQETRHWALLRDWHRQLGETQ